MTCDRVWSPRLIETDFMLSKMILFSINYLTDVLAGKIIIPFLGKRESVSLG